MIYLDSNDASHCSEIRQGPQAIEISPGIVHVSGREFRVRLHLSASILTGPTRSIGSKSMKNRRHRLLYFPKKRFSLSPGPIALSTDRITKGIHVYPEIHPRI